MPLTPTEITCIFFAVVGLVALAGVIYFFWRSPFTIAQTCLWILGLFLCRFLWRAESPGDLPVPADRGAILVSNHRSSVDPFFVQVHAGRVVHWMVAKEFVDFWAFSWFLNACEVIPVRRGGIDTAATKLAIRKVKAGGLVGMFPEGRINMTDDFMLPGRPGAAMIAMKTKAIMVPVYVEGSPYNQTAWSPFFMRARVRVRYGEPIDCAEIEVDEDDTDAVKRLMLHCLEQITLLADRPDFTPQLAGKKWKPSQEELEKDMANSARRHKEGIRG